MCPVCNTRSSSNVSRGSSRRQPRQRSPLSGNRHSRQRSMPSPKAFSGRGAWQKAAAQFVRTLRYVQRPHVPGMLSITHTGPVQPQRPRRVPSRRGNNARVALLTGRGMLSGAPTQTGRGVLSSLAYAKWLSTYGSWLIMLRTSSKRGQDCLGFTKISISSFPISDSRFFSVLSPRSPSRCCTRLRGGIGSGQRVADSKRTARSR